MKQKTEKLRDELKKSNEKEDLKHRDILKRLFQKGNIDVVGNQL